MLDYVIAPDGSVQESSSLIRKNIKAYLDGILGPDVPLLAAKKTELGEILLARNSAILEVDRMPQAHAHIRSALMQYVRAHYPKNWKLRVILSDVSSVMSGYLGAKTTDWGASQLIQTDLLVIEAPTWPRQRASKDHAATLLYQRLGLHKPTIICTVDLAAFTTGCLKDPRAYSQEFCTLLGGHADITTIKIDSEEFRKELRVPCE